jgi:hypothetical protein
LLNQAGDLSRIRHNDVTPTRLVFDTHTAGGTAL